MQEFATALLELLGEDKSEILDALLVFGERPRTCSTGRSMSADVTASR
jgi:hypothetical protein